MLPVSDILAYSFDAFCALLEGASVQIHDRIITSPKLIRRILLFQLIIQAKLMLNVLSRRRCVLLPFLVQKRLEIHPLLRDIPISCLEPI